MDVGTAMSVVQTLLTALQCPQLTDFCSITGYKSQLIQLRKTVTRIQAVLEDAEVKQEQYMSQEEKVYIEELKDAVYEADDLFDDFVTLAQKKKLNDGIKDRLMSLFTKLVVNFRTSQKIDKIKKKLDGIGYNNQLISFKHDSEPIKKISRVTCSYVHTVDVIGREDDLEKIVGMLLESDFERDVSFLSIVGMGGLGKTALAQLVFNDPRVTSTFPLKLWTCVSDQDQVHLDIEWILRKILAAITGEMNEGFTMERVQSDLRENIAGNKYLLILDDLWTEDREQWSKVIPFLMGGQRGSWIIVTTRSRRTAGIMGDNLIHELKGLSKENSWRLFERIAFGVENSKPARDLVNIGHNIVERCANVPLAIRVVGSLLYGQDESTWLSFQKLGLTKIVENKNGIMTILKLSYHQLESPLKSCFGYCALFPKDYVMDKKTLMRLWMAQGYIPVVDQRSMEDVAEEYFLVLLRRCFFQDVKEDEFGDIESCKMHDLMHDVAQEVVGKESCMGDAIIDIVDKNVRHFSCKRSEYENYTFTKSGIRSFLQVSSYHEYSKMDQLSMDTLLGNWKYLRVLALSNLDIKNLPSSLGELLHLRYLDLSSNYNLEMLPKQVTKLYNLQTLNLKFCRWLKELPKSMRKLVNLRVLDIVGCDGLTYMPFDIGKLDCLKELTMFAVGDSSWEKLLNSFEELKALRNLKGYLEIKIGFCRKDGKVRKVGENEGGCLRNKEYLKFLKLSFINEMEVEGRVGSDEELIEELQPHSNIKRLEIWSYQGVRMPKWARKGTLANLVKLNVSGCSNLQSLGCLGTLHCLKFLLLNYLLNLEFLSENHTSGGISDESSGAEELCLSLLPSLETLYLGYLPRFNRWWRVAMGDNDQFLQLPQLKMLEISNCPNLTANLECPALEIVELHRFNKKFKIITASATVVSDISPKLREVKMDSLKWLNSQNMEAFKCLVSLELRLDREVKNLEEGQEMFHSCFSSLRSLEIESCFNLRTVTVGVLEHLTALKTLTIASCRLLSLSEEDKGDGSTSGMTPKSLLPSLRTLTLRCLPLLVNLPYWIQYLTALQTLDLSECKKLESLPPWMTKLISLVELRLEHCSKRLKERCQRSNGEDWPHIQHISSIITRK